MLVGLLLILVLGALQLLNRLLYRDLCSPLSILSVFWISPCLLSYTKLSGLQTSTSSAGSIITFVCTLVLLATCLLPSAFKHAPPLPSLLDQSFSQVAVSFVRLIAVAIFFLVSVLLVEFSGESTFPLLEFLNKNITNPYSYLAGKDSRWQVIAFGIHAVSLFIFPIFLISHGFGKRTALFVIISVIFLLGIFKASKSDIYIPLLSFIAVFYYCRIIRDPFGTKQSWSKYRTSLPYIIFGCTSAILLPWITAIRLSGLDDPISYASLIDFESFEWMSNSFRELCAIVYGYTALGFENFRIFVDSHTWGYRLGTSFFRPLFSALVQGEFVEKRLPSPEELYYVSEAANTGTFLRALYIEGGFLFCLFGSLVYGILVNYFYIRFRAKGSLVSMACYVSMLYPWSWLFFTNAFSVLVIYTNLFWIFFLPFVFKSHPRCTQSHANCSSESLPLTHSSGSRHA